MLYKREGIGSHSEDTGKWWSPLLKGIWLTTHQDAQCWPLLMSFLSLGSGLHSLLLFETLFRHWKSALPCPVDPGFRLWTSFALVLNFSVPPWLRAWRARMKLDHSSSIAQVLSVSCAKWMNPHHDTQAGLWAHSARADGCTIRWVTGSGGASLTECLGWEENDSGLLDRQIWLQHQLPWLLTGAKSSPCPYLLLSWGLLAEGPRMPDRVA